MAKRIQVARDVPSFELDMMDGRILTWRLGNKALLYMAEVFGDAVGDVGAVAQRFAEDPNLLYHDLLYVGLQGQHPELTRESVREIPENIMVFAELAQALRDVMPEGSARPTIPDLVLVD